MSVKSMFEFKFSASTREEGIKLAQSIGNDMPPLDGYLDHEVIQDCDDPGHVMVNTHWSSREKANAVLTKYLHDPKIERATELLSGPPTGFVGDVLAHSS